MSEGRGNIANSAHQGHICIGQEGVYPAEGGMYNYTHLSKGRSVYIYIYIYCTCPGEGCLYTIQSYIYLSRRRGTYLSRGRGVYIPVQGEGYIYYTYLSRGRGVYIADGARMKDVDDLT